MLLNQRFNAKVQRGDEDSCWPWTGATFQQGYGKISVGPRKNVKVLKAHRVAWELHHGRPVPEGLVVCHSCDNKICVNPKHLRADTQAFNVHEAIERNRWKPNFGEKNGRTVLTAEDVKRMRESTKTQMALAAEFGISQTHVSRVIRGEYRF